MKDIAWRELNLERGCPTSVCPAGSDHGLPCQPGTVPWWNLAVPASAQEGKGTEFLPRGSVRETGASVEKGGEMGVKM